MGTPFCKRGSHGAKPGTLAPVPGAAPAWGRALCSTFTLCSPPEAVASPSGELNSRESSYALGCVTLEASAEKSSKHLAPDTLLSS